MTSSRMALFTFALLACHSSARAPMATGDQGSSSLILEDGAELSGQLFCQDLEIPVSARVTVTGDLHIVATGDVLIFGELVARDCASGPAGASDLHAPDLQIDCEGRFHVSHTGILAGGSGASLMTSEDSERISGNGGDGSSILVHCRTWTTCGTIIAGQGGQAGLGGVGGSGGDIRVTGRAGKSPEACVHLERGNVFGASGGKGGFGVNEADLLVLPGVPGRSGEVACLEPVEPGAQAPGDPLDEGG